MTFNTFIFDFKDKLNEPIGIDAIKDIEVKYGIELPYEYRRFITKIGNGGKNFKYGFLSIEESLSLLPERDLHCLVKPFPHQNAWNDNKQFFKPGKDYLTEFSDWNHYFSNFHLQGCIKILSVGCGEFLILVVSGEEKGNVWIDQRENGGGIWPLKNKNNRRLQFYSWYFSSISQRMVFQ